MGKEFTRGGRGSSSNLVNNNFKSVGSISEAKDRLSKLGVKSNLDKFTVEQANMILKAVENAPIDVLDELEITTIQKMKERGDFPTDSRYRPLQMNGVSKHNTIGYNYVKMKNLEKNKLEQNKKGNVFFNTTTEAMIHHELGHRLGSKRNLDTSAEWNKIALRWTSEQPFASTQGRKGTGFNNDFTYKEAFAEGYAGYVTKNPKLPTYVKDYFKKELSRKVTYDTKKDPYGNTFKVFRVN